MVNYWNITIPELTGNETRKAYVYLPESYMYEEDLCYPVLYMFDGHNVFFDDHATYGKCWGMKEYMDFTETPLIIVAIECDHSPDFGRLKEYSPFDFTDPKFGRITGKGQLTMEWFVHTLKPQIDEEYRTLPDREHTFIAGSSMGGLMSLYAVLRYNHIFSRAGVLSPSLWTNFREIERLIKTAPIQPGTVVYMDYGEKEADFRSGMRKKFERASNLLFEKRVLLTSRIVPDGTHSEASWERQLPLLMNTLMYGIEDELYLKMHGYETEADMDMDMNTDMDL